MTDERRSANGEQRTCAIILAAGSGLRMGSEVAKQFRSLAGKPVLAHTLDAFESAESVDCVAIVARAEEIDRCRDEVVDRFGVQESLCRCRRGKGTAGFGRRGAQGGE